MVAPKSSNAPGPSVPQRKIDQATVTGSLAPDGPQLRTIQVSAHAHPTPRGWCRVVELPGCNRHLLQFENLFRPWQRCFPQGAGKGKRVMVRSPEAAAQSGDALTVVGGGAQNTAEARVTSAQAPADAVIKQEAGSGTPSGVRALRRESCRASP